MKNEDKTITIDSLLKRFGEYALELQPKPTIHWSPYIDTSTSYELKMHGVMAEAGLSNMIVIGYIPVDKDHPAWR